MRKRMGIMNGCLEEVAPYVAMLTLECLIVGLNTLSKAAMSKGMSHFVFAFYANALAFIIIFPVCLILDRRKRAPLNLSIICKFFFISLLGSTINPNCTYAGIDYSSPTLGSSMRNLIPAFTFLLAVIFRMEKLNLKRWTSQVKIMATLVSIGGAFVLTFYEGPPLLGSSAKKESFVSTIQISYHQVEETNIYPSLTLVVSKEESNWLLGGFLLAIASLCISIWVTAQGPIVREYPSELTIVTFYFLFGSIQCAILAFFAERNNPNAWILRPHVELLPVAYSAVFASLGVFFVEIWCVKKKGPLFVALFKPPGVAIAAALNFILLHERLHTGTIVGTIIVMTGFYGVIWAKSKENEEDDQVHSQERTPLLESGFPYSVDPSSLVPVYTSIVSNAEIL